MPVLPRRFSLSTVLFAVCSLFISATALAEVYIFKDANGRVLITNNPNGANNFQLEKPHKPARNTVKVIRRQSSQLYPVRSRYDAIIKQLAHRLRLDAGLMKAVIHAESSFNPRAVSRAGAIGLMQLMPTTAKQYGVRNIMDPIQNMAAGGRHLKNLMNYYKDNTVLALAAYNAGQGAVRRYKGIPPYRETENYVRKVLSLSQMYRKG